MSNHYKFTYRFVTGEATVISLRELVTRGEITSDKAVVLEFEMAQFDVEDKKIERRETRRHSSLETMIEKFVPLEKIIQSKPLTLDEIVIRAEMVNLLYEAMASCLTETQCRRVVAHHGEGKTFRQIAEGERVNEISVRQSVKAAMQKMKKYFEKI